VKLRANVELCGAATSNGQNKIEFLAKYFFFKVMRDESNMQEHEFYTCERVFFLNFSHFDEKFLIYAKSAIRKNSDSTLRLYLEPHYL
jgi:hypothetical protein